MLLLPPKRPLAVSQTRASDRGARTRFFDTQLGAWRRGWTRAKNLTHWMTRAVRVCAAELGLSLAADGTVCGDHLVAIINRALQTLVSDTGGRGNHNIMKSRPQYDTEFPPLTVDELRRLVAYQSPATRQLHYAFDTQTGHLRVGCFHGYAVARPSSVIATTWDARRKANHHGAFSTTDEICFGRTELEQPVPNEEEEEEEAMMMRPFASSSSNKRPRKRRDLEAWLMHRLATQPLDALHFTHRFVLGELRLTHHEPPLAYRPVETPLLLDDVGAPFKGTKRKEEERGVPPPLVLRLYAPLSERHYHDVIFHDTVAAHVGSILERGLVPPTPNGEIYLWSWANAPTVRRRTPDARFYVHVRRAVREGGLRFFMSNEGSILCPSPIPMRFLELAEAIGGLGGVAR